MPRRGSRHEPSLSRKMRNEIMRKETPEMPWDLLSKPESQQKCCGKMMPKLTYESCVGCLGTRASAVLEPENMLPWHRRSCCLGTSDSAVLEPDNLPSWNQTVRCVGTRQSAVLEPDSLLSWNQEPDHLQTICCLGTR